MAHYVICTECNKTFNRDKVPCRPSPSHKGRYAHVECPKSEEVKIKLKKNKSEVEIKANDDEKTLLISTIEKIFGKVTQRIYLQISGFIKQGLSYKQMRQALEYFFIVKENPVEKSHGGIGIVPWVAEEAREYYEKIEKNREAARQSLSSYCNETETVVIPSPSRKKELTTGFFIEEEE